MLNTELIVNGVSQLDTNSASLQTGNLFKSFLPDKQTGKSFERYFVIAPKHADLLSNLMRWNELFVFKRSLSPGLVVDKLL